MGTDAHDHGAQASAWLVAFAEAIDSGSSSAVLDTLSPDASWRDAVAVTLDLHTFYGADQIRAALDCHLEDAGVHDIRLSTTHRPQCVIRANREVLEVIFDFRLAYGEGRGVARLIPDSSGTLRAWTLLTALETLTGAGAEDPVGEHFIRDFAAPNWLDRRVEAAAFANREPAVLVVGAGQAGLAAAARLGHLGVDTLVVDRMDRVGDNWRKRYHALVLHNEVYANHLPFVEFPKTWPTYVPKDMLADWFEGYAKALELNVWTGTEFEGAEFDADQGHWRARVRRADGTTRELKPRHIVMASGVSGLPFIPEIPGLDNFKGRVIHSTQFQGGHEFAGQRAIVIGTGTSGHDVAQDLASHGATVSMVQRSSSTVVSLGPEAAGKVYSLYLEGNNLADTDLINVATPYPVLRHSYQLLTHHLRSYDKPMLDGLEKVGFKLDYGADNTGFQMKYLRTGGGYYLDVGCAQMLIDGRISLIQYADLNEFDESGLVLADGTTVPADVVVLATGYLGQEELVRRLFSEETAGKVGKIWGYDDEGELHSMWRRTGQEGLWFTAGSLAQCRIYSQYLALQIKARELGLTTAHAPADEPRGRLRDVDLEDVEVAA